MSDDIISQIKGEFESGGNWPYHVGEHTFKQNPFSETWPGTQVFAGHETELKQLQENIQRNANTFITGPFGVGKTILTKTMYEILSDIDGYCPVLVNVEEGRFSKAMAERILDELEIDYNSGMKRANLYQIIVDELEELHDQGTRTIIFYDEVINGSDGTLRSILHLQRDVEDWEPVLVFNGTINIRDELYKKIRPLSDRISAQIHLEPFNIDDTLRFANKRLRYFCVSSEWNDGKCSHDRGNIAPFTRDTISLVHQDVTAYPRNLRDQLNVLVEHSAQHKLDEIDYAVAEDVIRDTAQDKIERVPDRGIRIIEFLSQNGASSANAISNSVDESTYNVQNTLNSLDENGLIRPTKSGRGVAYDLTPQAEKGLSSLREK
jgi:type II secretory pathway predicted ATPase ExeA